MKKKRTEKGGRRRTRSRSGISLLKLGKGLKTPGRGRRKNTDTCERGVSSTFQSRIVEYRAKKLLPCGVSAKRLLTVRVSKKKDDVGGEGKKGNQKEKGT